MGADGNGAGPTAAGFKRINRARVLNQLRAAGTISRADLARRTGLDPKTITNLINGLLAERLVVGRDTVARGRGRPAENLALNEDAALSIGLDLGAQQVSAVVLDLAGAVRARQHREFDAPRGREFLLAHAERAVQEMIDSLGPRLARRVRGIGFCVPGFLDRAAGVAIQCVNIRGFSHVPIVEPFAARFGLPVVLEEASRAKALAELWFGRHERAAHLLCLDLGFGIGMGIVHEGVLYRGTNESSGEIGHTIVDYNGILCRCGRRGCLETVASGRALHALARRMDLPGAGRGARAIYEAALSGHAAARKILCRTGEYLGMAIANVANLLDPDLVVLSGGLVEAGAMLVEPLRAAVAEHRVSRHHRPVAVQVSELGPLSGAMGAAMIPLRPYFEAPGMGPSPWCGDALVAGRPPAARARVRGRQGHS